MEIQGRIIQLLDEQSGQGRNGTWRKRDYVLETDGQYPKKVCFNLWGEKIDQYPVSVGDKVTLHFDIESREFNGRWYTDVKGWKIDKGQAASADAPPMPEEFVVPDDISAGDSPLPEEDDLPF